jgi:hypothetical protein
MVTFGKGKNKGVFMFNRDPFENYDEWKSDDEADTTNRYIHRTYDDSLVEDGDFYDDEFDEDSRADDLRDADYDSWLDDWNDNGY